ncbi:MAG TPA: endonuclease/exonuclease/phosphatase family protein [Patescibacteria group bacterium]|nr:endonuclease/exonuclease/phosphatase family protein [Patescibacteria group bacterium]
MTLKFLQLNIESGRFLDEVIAFIQKHDFDIINLQEVSGGKFNKYNQFDIFQTLKEKLGYKGELTKTMIGKSDPQSYFGNATFFKPSFSLLNKKEIIWLKPFVELSELPKNNFQTLPRNALHLTLTKDNLTLNVINAHLAWGPTPLDEPYKINQANILIDYMKNVSQPFVLSGDFNVTPDSQIVKNFNQLARNLTVENHLTNTLNAKTHRVLSLFPPGLAVDYIYTSQDIKVDKFEAIKETLSDHLGLMTEIVI